MKTPLLLSQVRPRDHQRYRQLPIFGGFLDDFVPWASSRGYTIHTLYLQLDAVRHLAAWFRRERRKRTIELTMDDLTAAHRSFSRARDPRYAWGLRGFIEFLQERKHLKPICPKPLTRSEQEVARYLAYLRKDCGMADSTRDTYRRHVQSFLNFLDFDRHKMAIKTLSLMTVHRHLRSVSGQYQRKTMQHVVGCVRGFLRYEFMRGVIACPLHAQIDTVRTYQDEHLPYPVQWSELQQLLHNIDRSTALGLRDYAVLLLGLTYGMRASDVAKLTFEAIDWHRRTIQIVQCKTRQPLSLPLTDEVGEALTDYIQRARPKSSSRYIFLRYKAPVAPLSLPGMCHTLRRASMTAGVSLKAAGFRCLRHACALRLLRRGSSIKEIGDLLGHRSTTSTSAYLRLNVEDIRPIALPAPASVNQETFEKVKRPAYWPRQQTEEHTAPIGWAWGSFLGEPMHEYLMTQRALGRNYETEERTLRGLDFFIVRHYPGAQHFTEEIFKAWAARFHSLCPTTARMRMLMVRKFCRHLARSRTRVFIPNLRTFPKAMPHQAPYLFSEREVARILAATVTLRSTRRNPLHPKTIRLALLLIFCCGLRRGEILKLRLEDIDQEAMILRIRETKFYKSRLVPLSSSVAEEVRQYFLERNQRGMPMEPSAPLVWNGYVRRKRRALALSIFAFWDTWRLICHSAKVFDRRGRAPRIHDLRHSFAVEVLRRSYDAGQNAQAVLPRLARYMGHSGVQFTHYYLKLTEPLRCAASDRFRRHLAFTTLSTDLEKGGVA